MSRSRRSISEPASPNLAPRTGVEHHSKQEQQQQQQQQHLHHQQQQPQQVVAPARRRSSVQSLNVLRKLSFTSSSSRSRLALSPGPALPPPVSSFSDLLDDNNSEGSSSRTTLSSSPNATTISSQDRSSCISGTPRHNLDTPDLLSNRKFGTVKRSQSRELGLHDFKILDGEFSKFVSKTGVHKANVLRLALLSFLRQKKGLTPSQHSILVPRSTDAVDSVSSDSFKIKVFQKWWSRILYAFRQRSINGSDRSAYLEALSGLLCRPEWSEDLATYRQLLYETLQLSIGKLDLKTVPLSVAAFSGKVLAYSFFFLPGVAQILINILNVSPQQISRIVETSFDKDKNVWFTGSQDDSDEEESADSNTADDDEQETYASAASDIKNYFPDYLSDCIGADNRQKLKIPLTSKPLHFLYGPWNRRWAAFSSDIFIAFLRHYYSILSCIFSHHSDFTSKPWNTHMASPGLATFHAFILYELDHVVQKPKRQSGKPSDNFDTVAVNPVPAIGKRRVDQLKVLSLIREILHNDENNAQYYERYCRQFENILHAVALSTKIYEFESCVVFADLAEEYISSLILLHPSTHQLVQICKDRAVDWGFWVGVAQKMLTTENTNTELRALSFLFNIWDNIPIGAPALSSWRRKSSMMSNADDRFGLYFDDYEGLRWKTTYWLLSLPMWKQYFCHWHPLVRGYYHRLLVWRIASVGPESDLLSSILFSNYNSDSRNLLHHQLKYTLSKVKMLIDGGVSISVERCFPVAHRVLDIRLNPAAVTQVGAGNTTSISDELIPADIRRMAPDFDSAYSPVSSGIFNHRPGAPIKTIASSSMINGGKANAFDVFDDIAYSYGASPQQPTGIGSATIGSRDSSETVRETPEKKKPSRVESLTSFFKRKSSKKDSPRLLSQEHRQNSMPSISSLSRSSSIASRRTSSSSSIKFQSLPVSVSTSPEAKSLFSIPEGNETNPSNAGTASLTMALIPPPPQLTRKSPELPRSFYRFGLSLCQSSVIKQRELIMGKRSAKNTPSKSPLKTNELLTSMARLPFGYSRTDSQSESVLDFYGDDDEVEDIRPALHLALASPDNVSVNDCMSNDSIYFSAITTPTSLVDNSSVLKKTTQPRVEMRQPALGTDEVKFWKYAGSSLAEWEIAVGEFEEFVRSSKIQSGISRLEDIKVPFMIAEIPNRAFGD